jgi:hypothetical protein
MLLLTDPDVPAATGIPRRFHSNFEGDLGMAQKIVVVIIGRDYSESE